jgi:uncharacterized membrane-anchored protein
MSIIEGLRVEIKKLSDQIKEIQDACSHPSACVSSVHKGDTGNWDNKDTYWVEHHCALCDKKWSEDK